MGQVFVQLVVQFQVSHQGQRIAIAQVLVAALTVDDAVTRKVDYWLILGSENPPMDD
jgi:hypothetical protein